MQQIQGGALQVTEENQMVFRFVNEEGANLLVVREVEQKAELKLPVEEHKFSFVVQCNIDQADRLFANILELAEARGLAVAGGFWPTAGEECNGQAEECEDVQDCQTVCQGGT